MENQQENFTPEQLEEKKVELMAFYKEQIEVLDLQKSYETLATEIEELRARRVMAQVRIAQMIAPPKEETEDPEEELQIKERTLRRNK